MESFLHGCNRGLPIHELRFEDVLFDGSDNWSDERFVTANDLNIVNLAIGSDCEGEVDRTGLSGQLRYQERIGTGDFSR